MLTSNPKLSVGVITLFPQMFEALKIGVIGRALKKNLLNLSFWNPYDYTASPCQTVDGRPYGGGPGMVMKFEPLATALKAAKAKLGENAQVIHLTPQGKLLTQKTVSEKIHVSPLVLITGRYEGIDERLIEAEVDEEWSVGDYILSGGELPAMVIIDAMTRLLPEALGHKDSANQDSFSSGLLDYPHYTRPKKIAGHVVPDVLLSGDHKAISQWRLKQSLHRTWQRRQDLIKGYPLSENEKQLLDECTEESL